MQAKAVRAAVRATLPVLAGYLFLGLAYGVLIFDVDELHASVDYGDDRAGSYFCSESASAGSVFCPSGPDANRNVNKRNERYLSHLYGVSDYRF